MIIDCVSDLHGHYPELEGGDLLIVAGDLTKSDTPYEFNQFTDWLRKQEYTKKIFIAGNHDTRLEKFNTAIQGYLCDSGTEFEGLKIWGSPWTKTFPGMNPKCKAFTLDSEQELAVKFNLIPEDTDILVTHTAPFGTMDDIYYHDHFIHVGSGNLMVNLLRLSKLKLHVFGHIHESYGRKKTDWGWMVNASHVNERYEPINKPIRVIL